MSESTEPLTRALWSRVATFWPPAFVDSVQEGVERARREHFAFVVDSPVAAYVAGRRPCDLYATEPFLDQMTYAFGVGRRAHAGGGDRRRQLLRADIDRELRRLKDNGLMQTMYLRWWRDECATDAAYVPHADSGGVAGGNFYDSVMTSAAKVGRQATAKSSAAGCRDVIVARRSLLQRCWTVAFGLMLIAVVVIAARN
jgi:hypothetical protein